jgi:PPOX class probable FMN-dependent enzyme
MSISTIADEAGLRTRYPGPADRSVRKTLPALDEHMRAFIALSPFLCLGTSAEGGGDVTPRGDAPGWVHVLDDRTVLIPDWPGNNRLDSLTNVLENHNVALLLFVPGVTETLRVNGTAEISVDPELVGRWTVNGRHPRSVLRVTVREAYLHCAKALLRSKLWEDDYKVDRAALPSYACMLKDQVPSMTETAAELEQVIAKSYATTLY